MSNTQQMADALCKMIRMHALWMRDGNHGASFYQNETLRLMNEAPIQARTALQDNGYPQPDLSDI